MRSVYILNFFIFILISGCSKEDPAPDRVKNLPPETPVLLKPANNEICIPANLLFEWKTAADPEGDDVSYQLEISTDQNLSSNLQVWQIGSPTAEMSMETGVTYFWRVKAIDIRNNESSYSEIRKFFTEPNPEFNRIPHQPEQVSPGNNSSVEGNKVLLKWTATDPDGDVLWYDVYFGTENPPQHIKEDHGNSSIELDIEPNKTYYWNITVKDEHGAKAIGEVWKFKS